MGLEACEWVGSEDRKDLELLEGRGGSFPCGRAGPGRGRAGAGGAPRVGHRRLCRKTRAKSKNASAIEFNLELLLSNPNYFKKIYYLADFYS